MRPGVLVISHGSREAEWVRLVDEAAADVAAVYRGWPVDGISAADAKADAVADVRTEADAAAGAIAEAIAGEEADVGADADVPAAARANVPVVSSFLEIVEDRLIQDGIDQLAAEGVTDVYVLPLFVSSGSTHVDDIAQAFGLPPVSADREGELEPFRLGGGGAGDGVGSDKGSDVGSDKNSDSETDMDRSGGSGADRGIGSDADRVGSSDDGGGPSLAAGLEGGSASGGASRQGGQRLRVHFGQPIDDDPDIAELLLSNIRELSEAPERERLLLVAHGSIEDGFHDRWQNGMTRLAGRMCELGGYAGAETAMLLPDQAASKLSVMLREQPDQAVIVVPLFLSSGYFTKTVIPARLGELAYRYNGRSLLPHPCVVRWMSRQIEVWLGGLQYSRADHGL